MEAPAPKKGVGGFAGSTHSLSHRDARAALTFVGELAGCEDEADLSAHLRGLRPLIGADAMILGTVERAGEGPPAIGAEEDPSGWFDRERREAFARWSHQQPLVVSHFGGMAPRAEKVSDFLSLRQWKRREIYNDFYRGAGLEWEIAVQIHASPGQIRCAAIQRSSSDFTERDRALLDLVGPHLRAAFARLAERAAMASRIALLERDLAALSEPAPQPITAAALAARLPLSPREAEVLARLVAGRTNAGIGHDLGISPHTVARHLERVYAKLGVQSRAGATAAAFEALA